MFGGWRWDGTEREGQGWVGFCIVEVCKKRLGMGVIP